MSELHISIIAKEIAVTPSQVKAVSALLDEGATVPFIARYRKEATGSGHTGAEATTKKEDVKPALKAVTKSDKDDKKTKRFVNNPFYEAFRKK